jgi:hypothetical protein
VAAYKHPTMCMLCWNNSSKKVLDGVISTNNYNPSNCITHIVNMHTKSEAPYIKFPNEVVISLDHHQSTQVTIGSGSGSTASKKKNYGTPSKYACEKANGLLYKFFNSANIAIRQANNEFLHDYTRYLIGNANILQSQQSNLLFSRYKYIKQELLLFNTFTTMVTNLVDRSRQFYKQQTNNQNGIPFLCVAHDGWDSKDHDVLGVSIHFIIPGEWVYLSMAVGLQRVESKRSADTVEHINKILRR